MMHLIDEDRKRHLLSADQREFKKELYRLINKRPMLSPNYISFGENGSYSNDATFESLMFSNSFQSSSKNSGLISFRMLVSLV